MNLLKMISAIALGSALLIGTAQATPITYTFSGTGGGTANGIAFSGPFTFVFTGNTTNIDASGAPFYRLANIGGTFTEGAFIANLTSTNTIVGTASASTPRINFFNATFDNGLGMNDPSLSSYQLATSFGPLTVTAPGSVASFLTPTFNASGNGFATSGGLVQITSDTSLTFTAALGTPEPASLAFITTGLFGLAVVRRRLRRSVA